MKRTVTIDTVGIEGVALQVVFSGQPCVAWPEVKTRFRSLRPGSPIADGRGYFLEVVSPTFKHPEEAQDWLIALTAEVKELASKDQATLADFKSLEGETKI